ncbi:copper-binding protein [Zobellella aerophila]|uniref:Copper-binding protein n=1 Tax=Zobellella aerophila TaxID=870480 RepID=A0ABP6VH66_9GAMM
MKKTLIGSFAIALVLSSTPLAAQQKMDDMKGMDMSTMPAAGDQVVHIAKGTVKKVDAEAGVVTLAHGPVESLNWPSMTMGFKVKDTTVLDQLSVGQTVEFEFVSADKGYVISGVK